MWSVILFFLTVSLLVFISVYQRRHGTSTQVFLKSSSTDEKIDQKNSDQRRRLAFFEEKVYDQNPFVHIQRTPKVTPSKPHLTLPPKERTDYNKVELRRIGNLRNHINTIPYDWEMSEPHPRPACLNYKNFIENGVPIDPISLLPLENTKSPDMVLQPNRINPNYMDSFCYSVETMNDLAQNSTHGGFRSPMTRENFYSDLVP